MKHAMTVNSIPATSGYLLLYVIGAILQALSLRGGELGTIYILIIGIDAALVFGLGVWLFAESVSAPKLAGIGLIMGGIALLHRP